MNINTEWWSSSPFSCSGIGDILSGNPKTCGSTFLRIHLLRERKSRVHALVFWEPRSSSAITQIWFKMILNIMKFHFLFSCFSLVNILHGNPSTCGSKFLRMQHFVKFNAQTFLESRSSSKLKDCTISEKIYVTWLHVFFESSAITQIWF